MSGGRGIGALVPVPIVGAALTAAIPPQTALEVDELAQYRLTTAVFMRSRPPADRSRRRRVPTRRLPETRCHPRDQLLTDEDDGAVLRLEPAN